MEKKITELFDSLTPEEAALAGDECRIERGDKDITARILSLTERKAGITMENRISHTKKYSRRFIGFMAAAAIAVTGIVGAGASYVYKKNSASERYFGAGADEKLESMGAKYEQTFKGKHFDINIETILSDGQYITVVANAEPNDERGAKMLQNCEEPWLHSVKSEISDTEFDEETNTLVENGRAVMRWSYVLDEPQDKVTMPMSLITFGIEGGKYITFAEFELTFEKNERTIILENAENEKISLCENSISGRDVTIAVKTDPLPFREVTVFYKDGTSKSIEIYGSSESRDDGHYDKIHISFLEFVDIDNVSAITIGGTRFEVK